MVAIELQEQLLAWERELDSREGALTMWEDGLVDFERALGKLCTERKANHAQTVAIQHDFSARTRASRSRLKQLISFNWMLKECQIHLCLQQTDLEVQETILVEEQACGTRGDSCTCGWDQG
jgi:hypothetical protein